MKKTNSLLTLAILATVSLPAIAQQRPYYDLDNDRHSRDELRHSFSDSQMRRDLRDYSRQVDICQDVKVNLQAAQAQYDQAQSMVDSLSSQVNRLSHQVNDKRRTLQRLERNLQDQTQQVQRITNMQANKPQLMNTHTSNLDRLAREIPKNQSKLERLKQREEEECKGFFNRLSRSCRNAKRARKDSESNLRTLVASQRDAQQSINYLDNIDIFLKDATKEQMKAQAKLTREQSKQPNLMQLENDLAAVRAQRDESGPRLADARMNYGQTAIRTEKCEIMKFEARKSRVFKQAIVDMAQDNARGCARAAQRIPRIRGYAAKEAMQEAYDLVCESEALIRYVEVPPTVD